MNDKVKILKTLGAICAALFVFGVAVMVVGYQPFDGKHVGTMIFVAAISVVCFVAAKRVQGASGKSD